MAHLNFNNINLYIECEKIKHAKYITVSLDQKSKTQLYAIFKKYTLKSEMKISWQQKMKEYIPCR